MDVDVDPDCGELVLDDLGRPRAAAVEGAVELGVVVAAAREACCGGEVGDEASRKPGMPGGMFIWAGAATVEKAPPFAASALRSIA